MEGKEARNSSEQHKAGKELTVDTLSLRLGHEISFSLFLCLSLLKQGHQPKVHLGAPGQQHQDPGQTSLPTVELRAGVRFRMPQAEGCPAAATEVLSTMRGRHICMPASREGQQPQKGILALDCLAAGTGLVVHLSLPLSRISLTIFQLANWPVVSGGFGGWDCISLSLFF